MAMMAITITSSISVKPWLSFFMEHSNVNKAPALLCRSPTQITVLIAKERRSA
jgi:hypothetical protein